MTAVIEALHMMEMNTDMHADYDFVHDVSNRPLEKDRAIAARRLEIKFFRRMKVYNKVPRSELKGRR